MLYVKERQLKILAPNQIKRNASMLGNLTFNLAPYCWQREHCRSEKDDPRDNLIPLFILKVFLGLLKTYKKKKGMAD